MSSIKKLIPVSLKASAAVFLRECGQVPVGLLLRHIRYSFLLNSGKSAEQKQHAAREIQQYNYEYLLGRYGKKALEFSKESVTDLRQEHLPIWIFWWQGETQAPRIVRCCMASIRANAGDHPVHIIDQQNYARYAQVSSTMLEKLKSGSISLTHFSDYYRMELLAQNGGLWIDASVFAWSQIPAYVFEGPLYTVRNPGMDSTNISDWNWMVGLIGGQRGNPLFHTAARLLECYWQDHRCLIDYFVFDYLVRIIYDTIPEIRAQIQQIPAGNRDFYQFQDAVNEPADCWDRLLEQSTGTNFFKISWKGNYQIQTPDGRETVFGRWLREYAPQD